MQIFENSFAKSVYFRQNLSQSKEIASIFILLFIDKVRKIKGQGVYFPNFVTYLTF